jgi:hypothetical protein
MLLRFFKMSATLFTILSLIGMSTLAPVNYYANVDKWNNSTYFDETHMLHLITIENVPQGSSILQFHLLYIWFISIVAWVFLTRFYRDYVHLKFEYTVCRNLMARKLY